jgi:signal transduction histidine kinase
MMLPVEADLGRSLGPAFARLACRLVQAPVAWLSRLSGGRHVLEGGAGLPASWAREGELPALARFSGVVAATAEPTSLADARADPRFQGELDLDGLELAALLGVPLRAARGEVFGVLCVGAPQPRTWTEAEQQALQDLATLFAAALGYPAETGPATSGVIDAIPQAVFLLDEEGRITAANGRAETLFSRLGSCPAGEFPGEAIWSVCPEVGDSTLARQCRQALAEQRALEQETYYPTLGRWFAVHVAPCAGQLVVSLQDVTDRTRLERDLVGRAEEQTETERARDDFLTGLADEVSAELTSTLAALDQARGPGGEGNEALRSAARLVGRLRAFLTGLREAIEVPSGGPELRRERVDLAAATAAAAAHLTDTGADLLIRLPPAPVWVEADPARLGQALDRLLARGVALGPPGVTLRLNVERAGPWAVVRVGDLPLAPGPVPHLTELFRPAGGAPGSLATRLDLGLLRRLAELHGGSCEVCAAGPGQGSELVLRLPAFPGPVAGPHAPAGTFVSDPPVEPVPGRADPFVPDPLNAADGPGAGQEGE